MITVAIVLALVAIGGLALLANLHQKQEERVRVERVMASLRAAVRRENAEPVPDGHPLEPAA